MLSLYYSTITKFGKLVLCSFIWTKTGFCFLRRLFVKSFSFLFHQRQPLTKGKPHQWACTA